MTRSLWKRVVLAGLLAATTMGPGSVSAGTRCIPLKVVGACVVVDGNGNGTYGAAVLLDPSGANSISAAVYCYEGAEHLRIRIGLYASDDEVFKSCV